MQSGVALIDEASTIEAMRGRRGAPRRPLPTGMLGTLTVVFWALWIYLVLPLLSMVLWATGVERFGREMSADSYRVLAQTLVGYSSTLLVLVGLLALWIVWNVSRYGGTHDRRRIKADEIADSEVWQRFHLDDAVGKSLRAARCVRVEVDATGSVIGLHRLSPVLAA
jgi:poly-beta-1,6-N-acetyl-D-glucosamine biosynthesis protein PgaD